MSGIILACGEPADCRVYGRERGTGTPVYYFSLGASSAMTAFVDSRYRDVNTFRPFSVRAITFPGTVTVTIQFSVW